MSRITASGALLLALAVGLPVHGAEPAQVAPAIVPETPPELPGDIGLSAPNGTHHHHGHSHVHEAPADRPPSLSPRSPATGDGAGYSVGPHGGRLIPLRDGDDQLELLYDDHRRAVTIYLPPRDATGYAADRHSHAPGEMAPALHPPSASHFNDAYGPYDCPLSRGGSAVAPCPLCPQEAHRPPVGRDAPYECEFERSRRGVPNGYPSQHAAPYPRGSY